MLYNATSTIGMILDYGVTNVTGDITTLLYAIIIFMMVLCLLLRMPIVASAILVLPFLIGVASELGTFQPILGVTLTYLGFVIAGYIVSK